MARTDFTSVEQYIAAHPAPVQAVLRRVRSVLRKALPGAEEGISYQIPTYKMHGAYVLYFAGWKQHYSLYPATEQVVAAFKDELAGYEVRKGTIRFPLSEPVPVTLIARIARWRAKETAERVKAAPAKKRAKAAPAKKRATAAPKKRAKAAPAKKRATAAPAKRR